MAGDVIIWLRLLLEKMLTVGFTGQITLNFHKGNLSRRYEVRKIEEAE